MPCPRESLPATGPVIVIVIRRSTRRVRRARAKADEDDNAIAFLDANRAPRDNRVHLRRCEGVAERGPYPQVSQRLCDILCDIVRALGLKAATSSDVATVRRP